MPKKVREIRFRPKMSSDTSYARNILERRVWKEGNGRVFDLDMEWFSSLVFRGRRGLSLFTDEAQRSRRIGTVPVSGKERGEKNDAD